MFGKYKSSKKKSHKRKSRNHIRGLVFVGGGLGGDFNKIITDAIKSNIEHFPDWNDVKKVEAIVTILNKLDISAREYFLSERVFFFILKNQAKFKTSPILYSIYNILLGTINKEGVEEAVLNIQTLLYDLITAHIKEVTSKEFKTEPPRFMFYCKMLIEARNSLESSLIENTRVKIEGPAVMEYMR